MLHPNIPQIHTLFMQSGGRLSTDTRTLREGDFFIALSGEHFNGNIFAKEALVKGATYVVIDDEKYYPEKENMQYIVVKNTTETLEQLAQYHRQQLSIPVIAIGGSNGKSTTKDLIRDVLTTQLRVCATAANDNNNIGVAQTLLRASDNDHDCVVLELGSNNSGEMEKVITMSAPSHGLLTNIGKEHLGNFGGLEGVIREECTLYDFLKKTKGVIFAPDNDPILREQLGNTPCIFYGESSESNYVVKKFGKSNSFFVEVEWGENLITTQLVGDYNIQNISAAIAVGSVFDINKNNIIRALSLYQPLGQRSQLVKTEHNTVIYDCYNSNPSSLALALENFAKLVIDANEKSKKEKVLIIGDILELGEYATAEHAHVIELLKKYNFKNVYLVGPELCRAGKGSGYPCFLDIDAIINELQARPIRNSVVFIKASKGILWKYHRFDEFDL